VLLCVALGFAATTEANPTKQDSAAEKTQAAIDPKAIDALKQMGTYLQQQESFAVRTTAQTDYVLDNGQKVKLATHGDLRVRRPDHLRADVTSDRKQRQFFYDGKTFTMYGPRVGYYAQVNAPPTIRELADVLATRYALQLPMVDLFRWGDPNAGTDEITSAVHVGYARLGEADTDHYAFRQKGVDWQVWIQRGPHPVPLKVVLTTTDDPARPEYAVEMKWSFNAKHDDKQFVFVPPKDSKQIALAEVEISQPEGATRSARQRKAR
jgi:hypothetical protein